MSDRLVLPTHHSDLGSDLFCDNMATSDAQGAQLAGHLPEMQSTAGYVPWRGSDEVDDGQTIVYMYQNIGFMKQHEPFSLEELRLNDYRNGRGPTWRSSNSANFISQTRMLAPARVPSEYSSRATCRVPEWLGLALGTTTITFRVGPSSASSDFVLHESLIAPQSEFVRRAMRGDWKEAQDRIIPLPEDLPDAFAVYQQWAYTKKIYSATKQCDIAKAAGEYSLLVRAYSLGDRLLDVEFKDAVIDSIIDKLLEQRRFDTRLTNEVYENTPSDSPLRRLWQDIYVHAGLSEWLDEKATGGPVSAEFLLDVARLQMRVTQASGEMIAPYLDGSQCQYHSHGFGACYTRMMMLS